MVASVEDGPKVLTIAIPSYNAEPYLDHCLSYFIASGLMDQLEILIVNDGSTDSTQEIARGYEQAYPDSVTVISKQNGGHGSTINTAIPRAHGKYFKVVDADDWVEPDALRVVIDLLERTDADLVLDPIFFFDVATGHKQLFYKRLFTRIPPLEKHEFSDLRITTPIMIHEAIFRTEILQANPKPLDEHTYYVDAEYIIYNLPHVTSVIVCPTPLYVYRYGSESQSISHLNLMRNVDQYHRAAISCLTYWNQILPSLDSAHRQCMYSYLSRLVSDHYHIYLDFPPTRKLQETMRRWHRESRRLMTSRAKPTFGPLLTAMIFVNFHALPLFYAANQVRLLFDQIILKVVVHLKPADENFLVNLAGKRKKAMVFPPSQ